MDINQVAAYLDVSHKTVRRYVKAGKLKVVYFEGKGVYDQAKVEALKADKQTPVHRAFPVVEEAIELSQFVPLETENQIIQFPQEFKEYYNLQYLAAKLTLSLEEAAIMSGFSKTGLRQAVKSGTLKAVKQGGRWRVRSRDLTEYINRTFDNANLENLDTTTTDFHHSDLPMDSALRL
jgi:excisionase family DNA binding protein